LQAATPLAVSVPGAATLGTLLYASMDAVMLIRAGGDDALPTVVLAYGAVGRSRRWWSPAVGSPVEFRHRGG
jgi:hypothetical protein